MDRSLLVSLVRLAVPELRVCVGGQRKGVLEIKVEKIELGAGRRRYHIRVRVSVTTRLNL